MYRHLLSADVNDEGMLTELGGIWTFMPTNLESEVEAVSPDMDYAWFGFWLEVTTNAAGDETFGIQGISGGSGEPYTQAQVDSLEGKATFEGDATGKYMAKMVTPYGAISEAVSGQFIADVEMTAVFGEVGQELVDDQNKVWGSIANFRDPAHMDNEAFFRRQSLDATMDPNPWSVDLMRADITGGGVDGDNMFRGDAVGDKSASMGSWTAQFFSGDADNEEMPGHVAGQFDAHFSNGHIVGGFAAAKKADAE
jgi:hypothetical protein